MQKLILLKDETAILQGKICPFRNPLVLPSQTLAGQLTIENIPCTSACPLFTFHKNDEIYVCVDEIYNCGYVNIRCGTGVKYDVQVIEEQKEQKSNLTI
jgi:hypothetical protein